jgi:hypothetical protein
MMKNLGTKSILAFAIAVLCFTACGKKEDGYVNTGVINTIGNFTITNFRTNGAEKQDLFTGYRFQFGSNLRLLAIKNGLVLQGEWRKQGDSISITNFVDYPLTLLNTKWQGKLINEYVIQTLRTDGLNTTELNMDVAK